MLNVSEEEVSARLADDNPWWGTPGYAGAVSNYRKRHYFDQFKQLVTESGLKRAVILMGPRRVGKTVMIHQLVNELISEGTAPENVMYAAIDTPTYSGLSLEKMIDIYCARVGVKKKSDDLFVMFDEVQYLQNWETHLKVLVDKYPNITFVASGSAAAALRLKSIESGAGRFTDFMLPPLTFAEFVDFIGKKDTLIREIATDTVTLYEPRDINALNDEFINYLNFGGYPEAVLNKAVRENPSRFIKGDIIDKVLLRDLPSLYGIENIQELNRLFTSVAYNTGNEISLKELSSSSGVASQTIKRYLEYLEAAFLITRVRRVNDLGKRFQREIGFKAYLTNPSMRTALFQKVSSDDQAMGAMAETAIYSQWFHSDDSNDQISYARWKNGEVDLVYVSSANMKPIWAVEVKWSDRFYERPQDLKSLLVFAKKNNLSAAGNELIVTTRTKSGTKTYDGISFMFVPTSIYCYMVGRNIINNIKTKLM